MSKRKIYYQNRVEVINLNDLHYGNRGIVLGGYTGKPGISFLAVKLDNSEVLEYFDEEDLKVIDSINTIRYSPAPTWKDKTCKTCKFRVESKCRVGPPISRVKGLSCYDYPTVHVQRFSSNHFQCQSACSLYQEEEK